MMSASKHVKCVQVPSVPTYKVVYVNLETGMNIPRFYFPCSVDQVGPTNSATSLNYEIIHVCVHWQVKKI